MDQILAQGLWAVRGIYGVLYTIRVENATAIFRTAWLFYGRRGCFSDGMVVLRTARWFFRTAGLLFSARGSVCPQVLPLEGKVSPQATEEVSYRIAVSFDGCKNGTNDTSSVIRLAGDAGCHPPLKGRDSARSPLRRAQKRNEFHPVLPLEGKVSPQATEEVSYRIAVCFDG